MKSLELLRGIKGVTTVVEWRTGFGEIIRFRQSGNVNASSAMQKERQWSAQASTGENIVIPSSIRRHEVSIAKYLAALNTVESWKDRV